MRSGGWSGVSFGFGGNDGEGTGLVLVVSREAADGGAVVEVVVVMVVVALVPDLGGVAASLPAVEEDVKAASKEEQSLGEGQPGSLFPIPKLSGRENEEEVKMAIS